MNDRPTTLRELFRERCSSHARTVGYVTLGADLEIERSVTFGELEASATALARRLAARAGPGDRVLLALDGGLESVELFWASILAGLVPIPAPGVDARSSRAVRDRLAGVAHDSQAALCMVRDGSAAALSGATPWADLRSLMDGPEADFENRDARPDDVAYLQYTSGSTSAPRGVEITHANVIAHNFAVDRFTEPHRRRRRGLTWLPWFHDFGLIQGVIFPLHSIGASYHLPATSFLRRPLSWLEAIDRYEVEITGAPDFAYAACVQALARKSSWRCDLGRLRLAFCGGEQVRAATIEAFTSAFSPYGFSPAAFTPGYGMAEAVLNVSTKPQGPSPTVLELDAERLERRLVAPPADPALRRTALVGCGELIDGVEARIVDPVAMTEAPAGAVGEIWIAGPSVARSYHGQPDATASILRARMAGDDREFARTGDLGFLRDGELFVAGRLKDVIISHGRNLYPQDLEFTAQRAHVAIRPLGALAFGVEIGGEERVALMIECMGSQPPETARAIVDAVRGAVASAHEVEIGDVRLLRAGALPRTSSGKPQRGEAKKLYLDGLFAPHEIAAPANAPNKAPRDDVERIVAEAWSELLPGARRDIDADFFAEGGSSLVATQLASRLANRFEVELSVRDVFERRTISGLAEAVRLAVARVRGGAGFDAPRAGASARLLSPTQERMWFMHQLAPESAAYNMPLAVRVRSRLDRDVLREAFRRVVARHEILRTTFEAVDGDAAPRVRAPFAPEIEVSQLPEGADLEAELARRAREPFDPGRLPLLRVTLFETGPDEQVLLIVMHHLIGDLWSFGVLGRELADAYEAAARGAPDALPPLPYQYADYAAWRRRGGEAVVDAQLDYWRRELAGAEPAVLEPDQPRGGGVLDRGASVRMTLEAADFAKLTRLGAGRGASLTMVMLAALDVLLAKHAGRSDIVVGVPIAGRNHLASEGLIGAFVNTLVMRANVGGEATFLELLDEVRKTALAAFANQDVPYERLVSELAIARHSAETPLAQVHLNVLNAPFPANLSAGASWSRVDFDRKTTQFELSVVVDPEMTGVVAFEYASDRFRAETVERLARRYVRLLRAVAAAPATKIADLEIEDEADRALVSGWENGPRAIAPSGSIVDWLRPSFRSRSASCAVRAGDRSMSFGEIDRASTAVAAALSARGLGRGSKVGLYVDRSVEMLVAVLGVLKCGAAYVPLEASHPAERLAHIARDAAVQLVVWSGVDPTAVLGDCACANVAELLGAQDVDAALDPSLAPRSSDPAYVMYTSGSTGRPKGVAVPHGAVVNLLRSMARRPGLFENDRFLAVSSLSFDISALELLLPLGVGATLTIASREDAMSGAALAGLIDRGAITVLQATPTTWRLLLDSGWRGDGRLKALVGGERLPAPLAQRLATACGEVWNMYGPTETTIWSTCARVHADAQDPVPIGRPIAATSAFVVGADGRRAPAGAEGELWIAGEGLAIGYVGDPGLTAERFVEAPFGANGARIRAYRTGDRVRWRSDGALEFLGRIDDQVKVRGHRIELGEIEAALERCPGVARAVATLSHVDRPGEERIVAHVQGAVGRAPLDLRLRRELPAAMVPHHYVFVDALPVLPSGKIDRRSLPPPVEHDERNNVPPRTDAEAAMWAIWSELLEKEAFGVYDDFFSLGGHSVLAIRLVHRIRSDLGAPCSLRDLFTNPCVADLSHALSGAEGAAEKSKVISLSPDRGGPTMFLVCGVNIYQPLANALAPHAHVVGVYVPSEADLFEADADIGSLTVERLALDYVEALKSKQPHGPYYLGGVSFGGLLAFEIARRLRALNEEVGLVALFDTVYPRSAIGSALRHVAFKVGRREFLPNPGWIERRLGFGMSRFDSAPGGESIGEIGETEEDRRIMSSRDAAFLALSRKYVVGPLDVPAILACAATPAARANADEWRRMIPHLEIADVPGDHLGILRDPQVAHLAGAIADRLPRRPPQALGASKTGAQATGRARGASRGG